MSLFRQGFLEAWDGVLYVWGFMAALAVPVAVVGLVWGLVWWWCGR